MIGVENEQPLRIALVQTDLYWENVTANLSSLEEKLALIDGSVDIIVLPEMFNTGFTMNTSLAEPVNLTTTKWMQQIAAQTGAMLVGSFAVKEGRNFFNRIFCVRPDGSFASYDKRHLFRMSEEHENYTAGAERIIVEWKGWKICPLICYDLRFPVWSRNSEQDTYDLLIYVANWPARRAHAWNILLQARAIENQAYLVGVNRVGIDGNTTAHRGDSVVLDFLGEPLLQLGNTEAIKTCSIFKKQLDNYRAAFPAHLDADQFLLVERKI